MVKWYLADIKRKVYDPIVFKNFKSAVRICMVNQMYNEKFMYVVPLKEKDVSKFKEEKLITR